MAIEMLRRLPGGKYEVVPDHGLYAPDGSRLVKATFLITCSDESNKGACRRIKSLMHDCEVEDAPPNASCDHAGTRTFSSTTDALVRMREIKRDAGTDARRVGVWVES